MRALPGLVVALALGWSAQNACAQQLRIGLGAPLSGGDAVVGNQVRLGVEQAVADINASGGFLGRKAKVVAGDDGGDPKKGADIARSFVTSGVGFVVGHVSSAVTVPASAIYAGAGVLDITPSALAPSVTDRGLATMFRTCGREDQQAGAATRFLLGRRYLKIAILHDRTATGKALADAIRASLAAGGTRDAFYGSFAQDTRDVSGLVKRLRAAGAQIVVWGGGPAGAATLARQLHDADAAIPLLGGMAMASDDFASLAGPAADGTFMVFPLDPRQRPSAAALRRRLEANDADPYGYVFYAYAAVQVIAQAAATTQSLDPKAIAATLHSGASFETVLGPLSFDAKGDPTTSDLAVYVWHKGPAGRMGFFDLAGS